MTYIIWIQYGCVLHPNLREQVALVRQQSMHIPNEAEIFFVARCLTYCLPPLFDRLEYSVLDSGGSYGGPLRKSSNQLIEKFLGADL